MTEVQESGESEPKYRPKIINKVDAGIGCGTLILGTILLRACIAEPIVERLDKIDRTIQGQYELRSQDVV